MIITDLMEYDGKKVRVTLETDEVVEGNIKYIPAYSEIYGWLRAHYFYVTFENNKMVSFRAHHVKTCELI